MINMTQISYFFTEDSVFRASRGLNFQKIFWLLRANHGAPSGDTNLSANLTDKNFEKFATMFLVFLFFLKSLCFNLLAEAAARGAL